ERPEGHEAPQLTDEVWQLAERCWANDPLKRPTSDAICDDIHSILNARKGAPMVLPNFGAQEISVWEEGRGRHATCSEPNTTARLSCHNPDPARLSRTSSPHDVLQ